MTTNSPEAQPQGVGPCLCCGWMPQLFQDHKCFPGGVPGWKLRCDKCGLQTCWWHSEVEAVEHWNARAPRDTAVDDTTIRRALRPIRGCATDDQYVDVWERVTALLATPRADLPRATADAFDKELVDAVATPWICVEEKPCEEAVAVHWEEMITALAAMRAPRATVDTDAARRAVQLLDDAGYLDEKWIAEQADLLASDRQEFFEACKVKMAEMIAAALVSTPRATGETTVEAERIWRKVRMAIQTYDGSGMLLGMKLGSATKDCYGSEPDR